MNISGVYKIQSITKPERIYIGSAVNIGRRWTKHRVELKKNLHPSLKLQRHYNKYGADDLKWEIILQCPKGELIENEQFFIDAYNPFFNTCKRAYSCLGVKRRPETREKISIANKGRKGQIPWNKGLIGHLSPDVIKKLSEAAKNRPSPKKGRSNSTETRKRISESNKGRVPWNKGKKATFEMRMKLSKAHLGKPGSTRGIKKMKPPWNIKAVLQYDIDGRFIREWKSIQSVESELKISHGNIISVLRGNRNKAGGFIWKYKIAS